MNETLTVADRLAGSFESMVERSFLDFLYGLIDLDKIEPRDQTQGGREEARQFGWMFDRK
jgi:hypothetical protein